MEFPHGASEDILDVREEREAASLKDLHAALHRLDRLLEAFARVRAAEERLQRSLEVLDRTGVRAFMDRPARAPNRGLGLVGLEALGLQTRVEDFRIREARRGLGVGLAKRLRFAREPSRHRAPRLDQAFVEQVPRPLDLT